MGMYFQDDFWAICAELPRSLQDKAIASLVRYFFTGEEPEFGGMAKVPFLAFQERIKLSRKNSMNGSRPRKRNANQKPNESANQTANQKPNQTDSQNVNEITNENANQTANETLTKTETNEEPNANQTNNEVLKREKEPKREKELQEEKELPKGNSKKKKFFPPSLDDVAAYVLSHGYSVDPERFVAFYESKGWVVGKSPMKDWKAAVRTWEYSNRPKGVTSHAELGNYTAAF